MLGRDLDMAEQACSPLERGFIEYCPDIHRQQNKVKRLKNRYMMINNQLQERWVMVAAVNNEYLGKYSEKYSFVSHLRAALIKEANNKNQDFQNALQSLDFFLINLPNNKVKPTDDAAQIAAKKYSQEVCRKYFSWLFFVGLF